MVTPFHLSVFCYRRWVLSTERLVNGKRVYPLFQRKMVTREHQEHNKHLNRAVSNDWGLYTFVQMLRYSAIRSLQTIAIRGTSGKEIFDNYLSDVG